MKVKITNGNLKFALFVDRTDDKVFVADDEQTDALFAIPGASEVGCFGLQPTAVIFEVENISDFTLKEKAEAIRQALAPFKSDVRKTRKKPAEKSFDEMTIAELKEELALAERESSPINIFAGEYMRQIRAAIKRKEESQS
jgi:hypothetical protein